MSKIEDYLKSMGNTPDEVAQYLKAEGIKGVKGDDCFCPIIKAIYHQFPNLSRGLKVQSVYYSAGYRSFGVYGSLYMEARTVVRVTWNDCQTMDPDCPDAIKNFVLNFDDGQYPDLVGESSKEIAQKAISKLTVEERMALKLNT
jgi:hypothetical protein